MPIYFGTLRIPQDNWSLLKQNLLSLYNTTIQRDFRTAQQGYSYIVGLAEYNIELNYRSELIAWLTRLDINIEAIQRIETSLLPQGRTAPLKPKKKDFQLATNKSSVILLDGVEVWLSNKKKAIKFKAKVESFSFTTTHPLVKVLYDSLKKISWTKSTGGIVYVSDEDNESTIPFKTFGV